MLDRDLGWALLAAAIGSLVLIIVGGQPNASRFHKKLGLAGLALESAAFILYFTLSLYFTHVSAHSEVSGTISQLKQFYGKYPSSDFTVIANIGETGRLHCRYNGDRLRNGESVAVKYLQYDHSVLELNILSGTARGWTLKESDGQLWCLVGIAIGAAIGFGTLYECRKYKRDWKSALARHK